MWISNLVNMAECLSRWKHTVHANLFTDSATVYCVLEFLHELQ